MLFWILIGLTIAVVLVTGAFGVLKNGAVEGVFNGFLNGMIGTVLTLVAVFAFSVSGAQSWNETSFTEQKLAALQTSASIEGQFFLGSGSVGDKRVLNYISNDDGAFRVGSVDASRAVIYEDSNSATMKVVRYEGRNDFLAPFPLSRKTETEFHVPQGSIMSDFSINNK